jgi:hypothetical protein
MFTPAWRCPAASRAGGQRVVLSDAVRGGYLCSQVAVKLVPPESAETESFLTPAGPHVDLDPARPAAWGCQA